MARHRQRKFPTFHSLPFPMTPPPRNGPTRPPSPPRIRRTRQFRNLSTCLGRMMQPTVPIQLPRTWMPPTPSQNSRRSFLMTPSLTSARSQTNEPNSGMSSRMELPPAYARPSPSFTRPTRPRNSPSVFDSGRITPGPAWTDLMIVFEDSSPSSSHPQSQSPAPSSPASAPNPESLNILSSTMPTMRSNSPPLPTSIDERSSRSSPP
jgi:hypothetical protein